MFIEEVNYFMVLIAAAVNMGVAIAWYSPYFFGKQWLELVDKPMEELDKNAKNAYTACGVGALIMSFILAHVIAMSELTGPIGGMIVGLWMWIGFVGAATLITYFFEDRPLGLWKIYVGYQLVAFLLMGFLLGF